jgi:hypothetical protein
MKWKKGKQFHFTQQAIDNDMLMQELRYQFRTLRDNKSSILWTYVVDKIEGGGVYIRPKGKKKRLETQAYIQFNWLNDGDVKLIKRVKIQKDPTFDFDDVTSEVVSTVVLGEKK